MRCKGPWSTAEIEAFLRESRVPIRIDPRAYGRDSFELVARHGVLPDGTVVEGVDAFREADAAAHPLGCGAMPGCSTPHTGEHTIMSESRGSGR
jgi:hypothetical protein